MKCSVRDLCVGPASSLRQNYSSILLLFPPLSTLPPILFFTCIPFIVHSSTVCPANFCCFVKCVVALPLCLSSDGYNFILPNRYHPYILLKKDGASTPSAHVQIHVLHKLVEVTVSQ